MTAVESPPLSRRDRPEFPRLPRAPVTGRRERWWFSDGTWIHQGQSSASTGVAWTHWLADRGVRIPDAKPDLQFATDLYDDSRRWAGMPVEEQSGSFLWAAAAVLQERGLVEECFECATVDTLIVALLEHGPVVAAVVWRESMFEPDRASGQPVCRVASESSLVGGHAILLDGIALDLELNGVTGFVRFKNSWGREWGEGGLCLISIEDLKTALATPEAYLPVPSADALGPGANRDVAPEDEGRRAFPTREEPPAEAGAAEVPTTPEPPPSEMVRYEQEAIGSDRWTDVDTVGYDVYADSIAGGIQHRDTSPPLTIGIKAAWGAGKTSLMRMVQRRLEWPMTWRTAARKSRAIRLAGGGGDEDRPVTNGAVLWSLRTHRRKGFEPVAGPEDEPGARDEDRARWRPTVWFNPWMYQTGEQVWAGLAHEIITQTTARMRRGDRERFWLELNLRRVDEQAVRRKLYSLVLERLVPWVLGGTVALAAGVALLATGAAVSLGTGLAAGGPGALLLVTALHAVGVLRGQASGTLGAVVQPATAARKLAASQLAGGLDQLMPEPDYASRTGFFHLVWTDLQRVLDLVATEDRPLVVFIDDLDRCSPGTVVQVIEAINVFLAGEFPNTIFVLAVEPEMVAAHIEAAYGDLVAKMDALDGPAGESAALGWKFLEKFIQLPLTLPLMEPTRARGFVGSLFPAAESEPGDDRAAPESKDGRGEAAIGTEPVQEQAETRAAVAAAEQMLARGSLESAVHLAGDIASGSAVGQALRRTVARKLSREDREMNDVIAYGARFLQPNPREIKRFANVFRFLVMIATERRLAELGAPDELAVLAKLAVLTTRWPSVTTDLTRPLASGNGRTVFELLEEPPRSQAKGPARRRAAERRSLEHALAGAGLGEGASKRLLGDDLRSFMSSKPQVGADARDWL